MRTRLATAVIPGGLTSLDNIKISAENQAMCRIVGRKCQWPELEKKVVKWVEERHSHRVGSAREQANLVSVCQWAKKTWQQLSNEYRGISLVSRNGWNCTRFMKRNRRWFRAAPEEEDSSQVEEEPDCDVYDDRITPEQWQELFGESDDKEEFHGFWRKTNKQTNGSFRSHQIWEKKWPMLHSFEISFRVK